VNEISFRDFGDSPQVVEPWQGFTEASRCPICGGYREAGDEADCHGYVSKDQAWVYCTREFRAEALEALSAPTAPAAELDDDTCTFSCDELLMPEPEPDLEGWLVDGRLPRSGTSILTGEAQVGKSTLARQLALSVARGAPWLGFATTGGPVLYLHFDTCLADLCADFEQIGLTPRDDVHFLLEAAEVGLLDQIRKRAWELEAALIVVDGLDPLLRLEESRQGSQSTSAFDRILGLAHATGAHLLLVHDFGRDGVREVSQLLAETVHPVDTILLLQRSGDRRALNTIQRRGDDIDCPLPIPLGETALESRPAEVEATPSTREVQSRILAYLGSIAKLATRHEIIENAGLDASLVLPELKALRRSGRVLELGQGTRYDPYLYTGCEVLSANSASPWLRKVRPWVNVANS
jgi:hypothetical protein